MSKINKNIPPLSADAADKLLANVFDACNQEHNSVPLDTLESYSEYRREKYGLQKVLLIIILVLFLALPFCFIAPEFTLDLLSEDFPRFPEYRVKVASFMPIRLVTADINGKNVPVYEAGEREFSIEPTVNGHLTVKVTLGNRQWNIKETDVSGIDIEAPVLLNDEHSGGYFNLYLTDGDGLGIDYGGIYGVLSNGTTIYPVSIDEGAGLVSFVFPDQSANFYIPDLKGNTLHLVLTIG